MSGPEVQTLERRQTPRTIERVVQVERQAPQKRRGKMSRAKRIGFAAVGVTLVAAGGLKLAEEVGLVHIGAKTVTNVPPPEVTVVRIQRIQDLCAVEVDSDINLKANEHKTVDLGLFSKTFWTNTTTAAEKGVGRLCLDTNDTTITVVSDPAKRTKTMDVVVNKVKPEGYLDHNGHDGAVPHDALGQRIGQLLGANGNPNVGAGLMLIGQTIAQHSACTNDAVPVAESQFNAIFTGLADSISQHTITQVNVSYTDVPAHQPSFSAGPINKELASMGVQIPSNWGVEALDQSCHVTMIDNKPLVVSQP